MTANVNLSLAKLKNALKDKGAERIFLKILSANDNSKQQVYFGSDFSVLNLIPHGATTSSPSTKNAIYKAPLHFFWMSNDGSTIEQAEGAQLISYPQYPEVRFSGFLRGCETAPSEILTERIAGRCILLGITKSGSIIGYAVRHDSSLAREILKTFESADKVATVFAEIPITGDRNENNKNEVLKTLKLIADKNWVDSRRLDSQGASLPCKSSNCGGYTLEAELGIRPNGISEPDFLGWEVKQHNVTNLLNPNVGILTLMTPEPKEGFYSSEGVIKFVEKYGYPDTHGREDRWNFGGVHKFGVEHPTTKLTLSLDGFNETNGKITDGNGGIVLYDRRGVAAAKWPFPELMTHWGRKHAKAVYVPSQNRREPRWQYRYGHKIRMGIKTDFTRLLKTIATSQVYYDPGIKVEGFLTTQPRAKRRSQFRIASRSLDALYESFELIDLS